MPVEVENAIIKHPDVLESAVIGVKDEKGLDKPMAFVVLLDGKGNHNSNGLEEELKDYIRKELPGYKVPSWIRFVPELPKTATGKFQRFKLRQDVREEQYKSSL